MCNLPLLYLLDVLWVVLGITENNISLVLLILIIVKTLKPKEVSRSRTADHSENIINKKLNFIAQIVTK